MAGKRPGKEDPVNRVKSIARNMLEGFFDDLMENNVLNGDELQRLGKRVNLIMNRSENLIEDITEKTQMAGKIFMDHLFNPKKQLSLKSHPENEDDESENTESSSSSTESEDENEESSNEEKSGSAQALSLPPPESGSEDEDDETEDNAGLSQAPVLPLTAPQETQVSQPNDKLKPCSHDHFHKLKTTKADEIYPVMEKNGRTRLALIICNKEFDCLTNRNGSEVDLLGMQELLENLGYSVVVEENLTALEMETALRQFAARREHRSSDSTFLVFMSHGNLDGIYGTKYSEQEPDILRDDTIFQIFNNRNCQSLKDKPKVIITQACRGRGDGSVWVTDSGEASAYRYNQPSQGYIWNDAITKTHVEKDFIAFKSSTPHNVSWRTDTNGSFFISKLIYYFKKYSCCHHLEEIFRKESVGIMTSVNLLF
ncbi:caspase-12-like isoform X2 [Diceros bicornis minor]|uniref:caspase-12-like isoform X2 n=1 Tax=Diceros bicornis minor TaxID=77932 RepID=UPI0026EF201A|nr:caspase-12-like isoform X2 [Diceros bicornis minor]